MHLILSAADSRELSKRELSAKFSGPSREPRRGLFGVEFELSDTAHAPFLVFARQLLPNAVDVSAASIRDWANLVVEGVIGVLPDEQTWSLHVVPFEDVEDGSPMGARAVHTRGRRGLAPKVSAAPPGAGEKRCALIRQAVIDVLAKRRRHLLRHLRRHDGVFVDDEALVQLVLLSPGNGFLSVAKAPLPFAEQHLISSFPGGVVPVAVDKQAPSRAFAKLIEAELRLGRRIGPRETCVDLGAAPGSWTYVAARRGAKVTAVDRAELRADLLEQKNVRFQRGDAFRFEPVEPVDWLLCDVIASAERSAENLLKWLRGGWCRQFVVTLKVDHDGSPDVLGLLERELPALASELRLMRLSANKKEVCAFGTLAEHAQFQREPAAG